MPPILPYIHGHEEHCAPDRRHFPRGVLAVKTGKSIRVGFVWTSLGYGVYTLTQWLVLIIVARLTEISTVGRLGLALAVCAPIYMLTNLGLRVGQATDAKREFSFGTYLALRTLSGICALLIACMVGTFIMLHGKPTVATVVTLVAITKLVDSQCDIFYGLFQQQERMDCTARSLILRSIVGVLALTAAMWSTGELAYGLVAQAIAWGIVHLSYDFAAARRLLPEGATLSIRPDWSRQQLLDLLRTSLPLGISAGLISLRQSMPRYVVQALLGLDAVGLYTAAHYFLNAATLFMNALGHTASARLARLFASGAARQFGRLLLKLAAVGLVAGLTLFFSVLIAGKPALFLLYGGEYRAAQVVLIALMAAAGVRFAATLIQFGVVASRRFGLHLMIQIALLALTIGLCYALTQIFGLAGAGYAVFGVSVFHLAIVGTAAFGMVSKLKRNQAIP